MQSKTNLAGFGASVRAAGTSSRSFETFDKWAAMYLRSPLLHIISQRFWISEREDFEGVVSGPVFSVLLSVSVDFAGGWVSIFGRCSFCGSLNLESMAWLMNSRCSFNSSNLHLKAWITEERVARSLMDCKNWGSFCCCCSSSSSCGCCCCSFCSGSTLTTANGSGMGSRGGMDGGD